MILHIFMYNVISDFSVAHQLAKEGLIRFWTRTEEDLSQDRVSCLCNRCLQKEREREILKGLLISEQIWLHRF